MRERIRRTGSLLLLAVLLLTTGGRSYGAVKMTDGERAELQKTEPLAEEIIPVEEPEQGSTGDCRGTVVVKAFDEESQDAVRGAVFRLMEWNGRWWDQLDTLAWDEEHQWYFIEGLERTEKNQGRFRIREEEVPEGYEGGWEQELLLARPGTEEFTFEMTNRRAKGTIQVEATDAENGEPLTGAVYQVTAAEDITTSGGTVLHRAGDLIETITSEDGYAETGLLDYGSYAVTELRPVPGYLRNEKEERITLARSLTRAVSIGVLVSFESEKNRIVFHKRGMASQGQTEKPTLAGAVFRFWNRENPALEERFETGEDGTWTMRGLFPGVYCYQEISAPEGYLTDTAVRSFTIGTDGRCVEDREGQLYIDNFFTRVEISKKDGMTGETLAGAKLCVVDAEGTVIREWTSTNEPFLLERLPKGTYLLKESKAPEGYLRAEDLPFEVKETGEVQKVVMEDLPEAELTVAKRVSADEITWSHGTPVFLMTVRGTDLWGKTHVYHISLILEQEYVEAHTDADGFVTIEQTLLVPAGSDYAITEQKVNRYALTAVTGTENVKICQTGDAAYGTAPEELFSVSADLTQRLQGTRVVFTNEKLRYDDYSHSDIVINKIPLVK